MFPKGGPGRRCPRVQEPGQAQAEEVGLSRTSRWKATVGTCVLDTVLHSGAGNGLK